MCLLTPTHQSITIQNWNPQSLRWSHTQNHSFFIHIQNYSTPPTQFRMFGESMWFGIWWHNKIDVMILFATFFFTRSTIQIRTQSTKENIQINSYIKWNTLIPQTNEIQCTKFYQKKTSVFLVFSLFIQVFFFSINNFHFFSCFTFDVYTTRNVSHSIDTALRRILTIISWWSCWTITGFNVSMYLCLHSNDLRCTLNRNSNSITHTCECIQCGTENDVNTNTYTHTHNDINICKSVLTFTRRAMKLCFSEQVNDKRTHSHTSWSMDVNSTEDRESAHKYTFMPHATTYKHKHIRKTIEHTCIDFSVLYCIVLCTLVCWKSSFKYWENPAMLFIFIYEFARPFRVHCLFEQMELKKTNKAIVIFEFQTKKAAARGNK